MDLASSDRGPRPNVATGAAPAKMRGGVAPMLTARVGDAGPGSAPSRRFIQPSWVFL